MSTRTGAQTKITQDSTNDMPHQVVSILGAQLFVEYGHFLNGTYNPTPIVSRDDLAAAKVAVRRGWVKEQAIWTKLLTEVAGVNVWEPEIDTCRGDWDLDKTVEALVKDPGHDHPVATLLAIQHGGVPLILLDAYLTVMGYIRDMPTYRHLYPTTEQWALILELAARHPKYECFSRVMHSFPIGALTPDALDQAIYTTSWVGHSRVLADLLSITLPSGPVGDTVLAPLKVGNTLEESLENAINHGHEQVAQLLAHDTRLYKGVSSLVSIPLSNACVKGRVSVVEGMLGALARCRAEWAAKSAGGPTSRVVGTIDDYVRYAFTRATELIEEARTSTDEGTDTRVKIQRVVQCKRLLARWVV